MRELWNKILNNVTILTRARFQSDSVDSISLVPYTTTVTVASGQTTGVESTIRLPANFLPMAVAITTTTASTNAVNLTSVGIQAAGTVFVTGITAAMNTLGYKGMWGSSGARGMTGTTGALATPDEVSVTLSGDPGASGCTVRLTFLGLQLSQ